MSNDSITQRRGSWVDWNAFGLKEPEKAHALRARGLDIELIGETEFRRKL